MVTGTALCGTVWVDSIKPSQRPGLTGLNKLTYISYPSVNKTPMPVRVCGQDMAYALKLYTAVGGRDI